MDSRKCSDHRPGVEAVRTVMPPSTAWAAMPSTPARRAPRVARAATARGDDGDGDPVSDAGEHPVPELDDAVAHLRCRDEDASVHCGQVGQPSPEPVSRTARR